MSTNEIAAVESYKLVARTGRPIRTATRVVFTDGRTVEFMERMSKREAIRQALRAVAA